MEQRLIDFLIKFRYLLALLSIGITVVIANGASNLYFDTDYKSFFSKTDPRLVAHLEIEETFTKSDNLTVMLKPMDGELFTKRNLSIIHEITELAWQAPYVMRVDSLTNFQHTKADGDDLLVANLLEHPEDLTSATIENIKQIALTEKAIVNRLLSGDGGTALINITVELPPIPDISLSEELQKKQRAELEASLPKLIAFGREIEDEYTQRYPDLEMHLGGVTVVNNSFTESSMKDLELLVPLMYVMIVVVLAIFLRSLGSLVGTVLVIAFASVVGITSAGWLGYAINGVNVVAPTIILTIAVCDAVHLLMVYLRGLSTKMAPIDAMRESLRLNLQPIVLTSVTTAVGFLTLNFSISPPFGQLGNMAAIGVMWAMVLTFTLLPSITMLLVRKRKEQKQSEQALTNFAHFVVKNYKSVFATSLIFAALLISFIPLNVIDDDPINYFKPGVPYRDASEFAIDNSLGVNDINFSIDCGEPGCINGTDYLKTLDQFDQFLREQEFVIHVSTYSDVLKRLNKSMNRDKESFYKIPDDSNLSAQYNLLYEMSLPYGLDLNNQINIDKSATKVTVMADRMTSDELIDLESNSNQWLKDNFSKDSPPGASVILMFAHVGVENIRSMLLGGVFAIIGVTLTILIALRSFKYALISMIPNSIPALMAFGVWGLTIAEVNMAVAGVFSISLGILVDDTVHFISKYRRGREIKKLSSEDSIYYAFANVGSALIVTTIVLVIGFGLLMMSGFNLNAMTGQLTAITIGLALIFDFLILPPLLLMIDKNKYAL